MPRIELPSKQADGTAQNWVDVREPDDFLAEDLFAIHRAARITTSADGGTSYSPREMDDDSANAFLAVAITAWSFPSPVPSQINVAAADKVIGRAMKAKDYAVLRKAVRPLIDELEGVEREDPKQPLAG
jgi:hypothetical protein